MSLFEKGGVEIATTTGESKLRRSLGPFDVAFLACSAASPAASVYLYGDGLIAIGGSGAVLAVAIGGPIAGVLGLLFGEIAAAFPEAGGAYPAFVKVLGERLSFPYVVLMLLISISATAFTLLGLADYVRRLSRRPLSAWPSSPRYSRAAARRGFCISAKR